MIDHQLKFINICFNHHLPDVPLALVADILRLQDQIPPKFKKNVYFVLYICYICPKKLISNIFVCH